MTDTHAHLDQIEPPEAALLGAENFRAVLCPGTEVHSCQAALNWAEQHLQVYAAVGIHPSEAKGFRPSCAGWLGELAQHPRVRAIGECGLDTYWDDTFLLEQIAALEFQAELARQLDLPLILHVRSREDGRSELELNKLLRSWGPGRYILHAFGGNLELAETALERGAYVSFAGNLTFKKNQYLRQAAGQIPRERILLETDSPYLAPEPYRGKPNRPGYVRATLNKLAEVLAMDPLALETQTDANAEQAFRW